LFKSGNDSKKIPVEYQRIVQKTLDLKNDIEFGYAYNLAQAGYTELLGSRAYQRALNRWKAEEDTRIRAEIEASKHK